MIIRPATPADCADLCRLIGQLAAHHGDLSAATPATVARDLFGPQPAASALVAAGDDQLFGYVVLTRGVQMQSGQRGMDMHHLFVVPAARGQGLGRALVAAALGVARQEGCAYITVSTAPDNLAAQAFYPTLGFTRYTPQGARFWQDLTVKSAR